PRFRRGVEPRPGHRHRPPLRQLSRMQRRRICQSQPGALAGLVPQPGDQQEDQMELSMNGRNALVTGGSQGNGLAIAPATSRAGAGANVAIVARQEQGLDAAKAQIAAKANTKVITIAADVGTAAGCRTAFETADKGLGHIDVLVNNAGTSQRGSFVEITDEVWQ